MLTENQWQEVIGATACGSDGEKLGKVGQLFLDDGSRQPEFVTVRTGLFGHRESFVPVRDAVLEDDRLLVPYTKDQVKDAPNVDVDAGHLDPEAELHLWAHYGLQSDSTVMESLGGAPVDGAPADGSPAGGAQAGGRHAARPDDDAEQATGQSRLRRHLPGAGHDTSN